MADAPYFDKIIVNDDLTTAKAHLDQEIAAGSQKNNQLLSQQQ
jgi:guanylate kinase